MLFKYDTSNGSTKCPQSELANIASIYTHRGIILNSLKVSIFSQVLDLNCAELWALSPWILYVSLLTFLSQPASTPQCTSNITCITFNPIQTWSSHFYSFNSDTRCVQKVHWIITLNSNSIPSGSNLILYSIWFNLL